MDISRLFSSGWSRGTTPSIAILLATALLGFGLAIYLFDWDRVNRARRGHPAMALLVLVPFVLGIFLG